VEVRNVYGGGETRTPVHSNLHQKSFTGLVIFSKITNFYRTIPNQSYRSQIPPATSRVADFVFLILGIKVIRETPLCR